MADERRQGRRAGWRLSKALLALALAAPAALRADIAPPIPKPVRPSCVLADRIARVDAARRPVPSVAAHGMARSIGPESSRLVYRGLTGAGTRRATATFDFMVCGEPRRSGGPVTVQAKAAWPAGLAPASVRFIAVRGAANAVTVPF